MTGFEEEYLKKIEKVAAQCTESQSDGYSKILRICQAITSEESEETTKPINAFSESKAEMRTLSIDLGGLDQFAKEHPEVD